MEVPRPEDVASIDTIIAALYDSISFQPGGEPDWNRLRSLMYPGARLVPTGSKAGEDTPVMDVEQFVVGSDHAIKESELQKRGFIERAIRNQVDRFGAIAHVLSTYESLFEDDKSVFARGVNSIQLIHTRNRWWCLTILWDDEREDNRIPDKYLLGR
jgi:hypothetical protein